MVDVSKLSQYAIVRNPVTISKLSLLAPTATPDIVGKLSMYALIGGSAAAISAQFNFDWKVSLSYDLDFDWRINTVFNQTFDFDWKIDSDLLNVDFIFDWRIRARVDFQFDYQIQDQPPDAGTPVPGGAHSYWRIRYRSAEVDNVQFSEVYFLDAANTDLCTGGTVIKSSEFNNSNFAAANAFDRNTSTGYAASGNRGQWIGYHFASDVEVDKIRLRASAAFPSNNATQILVEYSDDGTTWKTLSALADPSGAMSSGADRTIDFVNENYYSGGDTSNHRYWRMRSLISGVDSFQALTSIDLLDGSGTSLTTSGTGSASNSQGSFPGSQAWDKNNSTIWYSNGLFGEFWLKWDFGSGNAQAPAKLFIRANSSDPTRTLAAFAVEFSDDDTNWTVRYVQDGFETWTSSQERTYTFGAPAGPGDIYHDFAFNWKIAHNIDYPFDWKIDRRVTRDFNFDWQVEAFGRSATFDYRILQATEFAFDWGILQGTAFDFDWKVNGEFRTDFHFDWQVKLGIGQSFDWKIRLGAAFTFDYKIGEVGGANGVYVKRLPEIPVKETWAYKTAVMASSNNTERRANLRRFPQITLGHTYAIQDEIDYREFRRILLSQRYTDLFVAHHSQAVFVGETNAYGSDTLALTLGQMDVRDGDIVAAYNVGTEDAYLLTVDTVGVDVLNLTAGLPVEIGQGWAVMPARPMRLLAGQSMSAGALAGSTDLAFEDTAVRSVVRPGVSVALDAMEGRPLLTGRALANSDVSYAFSTGTGYLDLSADLPAKPVRWWSMLEESFAYTIQFDRVTDLDYWREFADTVRGNWKAFYLPSFRNDLELVSFAGASLTVAGNDQLDVITSTQYGHLRIVTDTGEQFFGVSIAIPAGENTVITLSGAIVGTVIKSISFVMRVRITDDKFDFTHFETFTELALNLKVVKV